MKSMMKAYLCKFLNEFSFLEEACETLMQTYATITADTSLTADWKRLLKRYDEEIECDFTKLLDDMELLCVRADIHKYTGELLLLICLSERLKDYYAEAGLDEEIWHTSMLDLKWKMMECKSVHGVWGTASAAFQSRFFQMKRFGFGKLQFNLQQFDSDYDKNGVKLTPESQVIAVHIPRTGTRLDRETLVKSYAKAAEFYRKIFEGNPIVFVCHSWLLFPKNKEVLSPESNLHFFMRDYDIIGQGEYQDYSQVWRLFDVNYNGDVEQLPQNTSLRRAYADWIRKGEKTGWGYGVYVYKDSNKRGDDYAIS